MSEQSRDVELAKERAAKETYKHKFEQLTYTIQVLFQESTRLNTYAASNVAEIEARNGAAGGERATLTLEECETIKQSIQLRDANFLLEGELANAKEELEGLRARNSELEDKVASLSTEVDSLKLRLVEQLQEFAEKQSAVPIVVRRDYDDRRDRDKGGGNGGSGGGASAPDDRSDGAASDGGADQADASGGGGGGGEGAHRHTADSSGASSRSDSGSRSQRATGIVAAAHTPSMPVSSSTSTSTATSAHVGATIVSASTLFNGSSAADNVQNSAPPVPPRSLGIAASVQRAASSAAADAKPPAAPKRPPPKFSRAVKFDASTLSNITSPNIIGTKEYLEVKRRVVLIQSLVRMRIARRRYLRIKTRENIVKEIMATERSYVADLNKLITHFLRPLSAAAEQGKPIVSVQDIRFLFSQIEVIFLYNENFLVELEHRTLLQENVGYERKEIGDVFCKFADFLRCYVNYVNNYNVSLMTLSRCQKMSAFRDFRKKAEKECGEDLESLLIKPIQRVPRYCLLLNDLIKKTDETHCDRRNLERALAKMRETATTLNESKRESEAFAEVIRIYGELEPKQGVVGDLVQPHRRFVRSGSAKSTESGKSTHLHLFNDLLVVSRREAERRFRVLRTVELEDIIEVVAAPTVATASADATSTSAATSGGAAIDDADEEEHLDPADDESGVILLLKWYESDAAAELDEASVLSLQFDTHAERDSWLQQMQESIRLLRRQVGTLKRSNASIRRELSQSKRSQRNQQLKRPVQSE